MANILVIAEYDAGRLKPATLSAIACAQRVAAESGGSFKILILGEGCLQCAEALRGYGASAVLTADHPQLRYPVADKYAHVVALTVRQGDASMLVAAASTFSKDILPRAAALLDAGMLSDVIDVRWQGEEFIFSRVMYAGNVIATVKLDGRLKVFTVRAAAFSQPVGAAELSPLVEVTINAAELPALIEYGGREAKESKRPDPTEAQVVVSGGRGVKNAEDFERLIGGLADVLGGAVGSSRALVDAGVTPNSLQVGQTGKIVAPQLYIAVGISGAIQHLAGMKDAKVIVAINKDADAPIFEIADYGLVGDAYQVVPELVSKLKQ